MYRTYRHTDIQTYTHVTLSAYYSVPHLLSLPGRGCYCCCYSDLACELEQMHDLAVVITVGGCDRD